MDACFRNARARNTHVAATLNHPFPAQASIAAFGHFPVDASCLNDTAPELQRLVALVSMAPRSKAPEDVLVKRRGAYVGEQTTSHWPFRFDADAPTEQPTRRDADLTPAMRRLIG